MNNGMDRAPTFICFPAHPKQGSKEVEKQN